MKKEQKIDKQLKIFKIILVRQRIAIRGIFANSQRIVKTDSNCHPKICLCLCLCLYNSHGPFWSISRILGHHQNMLILSQI